MWIINRRGFIHKLFVKIQFRKRLQKKLNLKNPQTFNEKLQWLKLYNRKPEHTQMVDKYAVKDEFLKLNEVFPDAKITFRPHPLMFGNFISKGLMTNNEVEEYKNKMLSNGIMQSSNDSVEDDFDSTDILLTDYSSIMIQYFLTGKPIVYCPAEYELNEEYKRILDGVYVANSWQDAVDIMKELLDGKDILKEKREAIIKQYFTDVKGSSKRIVTRIYDDYMERKNLFRR